MLSARPPALEARPRGDQRVPISRSRPADDWRLLVSIARIRWGAVGLATAYAIFGPHPGVSQVPLLLLAGLAASYNVAVMCHQHLPGVRLRTMTLANVAVDFAWVTVAAALLTAKQGGSTAIIGYVVLGSECGLLLGWQGAAAAVPAGVAALVLLETLAAPMAGGVTEVRGFVYQAGALAIAAGFAAVASAELRERHRELAAKTVALSAHLRTDQLTGLANALAMEETLAALANRPYGLLLIDIDRLKWANDLYGHEAGDRILIGVATLLANLREADDVAIRLREDKFVLVLAGAGETRAQGVADTVRVAAHDVVVSGGHLRVSIGCVWTRGGESPTAILARADDALYAAKAGGGDRVALQSGSAGQGRRLREAVQSVLESEQGVYSVYQRIVRLSRRVTVGWEALSRPRDWPADASVEAMFVAAHRMGRGRDLDWVCRRNALLEASQLRGWLFVNISVVGLLDPIHDVDQMLLLCEWAHRDPQTVVLELSERDATPDLGRLRQVLLDYRAAGFRFAIDDLGEGQTTLEVVLSARPEFLKLARPLLQSARADLTARAAAAALVRFAHDIESVVIAEGVEDDPDLDMCASLGVDLGQGWLFGRPAPAEHVSL